MNVHINRGQSGLWLRWTAFSILAYLSGIGLFMAGLGRLLNNAPPMVFGAALGGVLGLLSGIGQLVILKKRVPGLTRWIPATVAGWVIFWSLNMGGYWGRGYDLKTKLLEGLLHGLVFGLILGTSQWLAIRHAGKRTVAWLLANGLIWPICAMIADGLKMGFRMEGPVEFLVALPLSALFLGFAIQRCLPTP